MVITSYDTVQQKIWSILETITDPEIPVLTIIDLGIVRDVRCNDDEIEIMVTPTYSGCPAVDVININIRMALLEAGFQNIKITQKLFPIWTTDWISESGKEKLKAYGIAPPSASNTIECPQCHSTNIKLISQFGSTACKALYQCADCKEPFDYFKCH
jgi:ring-1,2-phenylacetyl-CoA epoxidase subunit PaaD